EHFHELSTCLPPSHVPHYLKGRRMDWRTTSACRDEDPELFFPIGTTGPAVDQMDAAKRICNTCDVREECLEFALATNQDAGIWGGLNEDERRTLRRQRQRQRRRVAV
ncbi:MAG: WhiB family redox-sensing transcriptional regulator, partial [Nitriliruptoraceae bacterium]